MVRVSRALQHDIAGSVEPKKNNEMVMSDKELCAEWRKVSDSSENKVKVHPLDSASRVDLHFFHFVRVKLLLDPLSQCRC